MSDVQQGTPNEEKLTRILNTYITKLSNAQLDLLLKEDDNVQLTAEVDALKGELAATRAELESAKAANLAVDSEVVSGEVIN